MQTHLTGSNFFLTPPPHPTKMEREREKKQLNSEHYWFVIPLFRHLYSTGIFQLHRSFWIASLFSIPPGPATCCRAVMDTRKHVRITALIPIHTLISTYRFVYELTEPSGYSCLSFLFLFFLGNCWKMLSVCTINTRARSRLSQGAVNGTMV